MAPRLLRILFLGVIYCLLRAVFSRDDMADSLISWMPIARNGFSMSCCLVPPPVFPVEPHCRSFPRPTYTTACGIFSDFKVVRPIAMSSCQNIEHAFQQCRGVVPRVTHWTALLGFARFFPYTSRAVSSDIFWGALAKNIGEMALGSILLFFLERNW